MKFSRNDEFIKKEDIFPCYSIKLNDFLQKEWEIMPIRVFLNEYTNKTCYVFLRNTDLDAALKEWKQRKVTGNLYAPDKKGEL